VHLRSSPVVDLFVDDTPLVDETREGDNLQSREVKRSSI